MTEPAFDWQQLTPVPVAVPEALATRIERGLANGSIAPGTKLPTERELAQRLGVSRASVREAMHELTLKGWLTRKPGLGTVVQPRSRRTHELLERMDSEARDLREVADFRQLFEPHIAELAATRATTSELHQLEELCEADADLLTPSASVDLDNRFHRCLAGATHNQLIVAASDISAAWVFDFRLDAQQTLEGRRASIEGHREIAAAIRSRNPAAAAAAMTRHIARFHEVIALQTDRRKAG